MFSTHIIFKKYIFYLQSVEPINAKHVNVKGYVRIPPNRDILSKNRYI